MSVSYRLYKDGRFYGSGSREYMNELIRDYVVTMEMYGRDSVTFEIRSSSKSETYGEHYEYMSSAELIEVIRKLEREVERMSSLIKG